MDYKGFLAVSIAVLILASCVSAEQTAGVTPKSWFYFLDVWLDAIKIKFSFSENKNSKIIEVAEERAAEMEVLLEKNDTKGLITAQNELSRLVARVDESKNPGRTAALNTVIESLDEKITAKLKEGDNLQISSAKTAIDTIKKKTNPITDANAEDSTRPVQLGAVNEETLVAVSQPAADSASTRITESELRDRQEFVYVQGRQLMLDGKPYFAKGANWLGGRYIQEWPKVNGTEVYGNGLYLLDPYYDPEKIDAELKELKSILGVNTLRIPIVAQYTSDGTITEQSGKRLRDFTRMAHRNGIRIHWVFFFGHGKWVCPDENGNTVPCDPRGKPDIGKAQFYRPGSDTERILLNQVRTTVAWLKNEPGVISYEFFNEILLNFVVRTPGYQEQVLSFITRAIMALREVDNNHLIASGEVTVVDGPSDNRFPWLEGKGVEYLKFEDIDNLNGGEPFSLYDKVDYVAPHMYIGPDKVRTAVDVILANSQKPVVFGEFGGGGYTDGINFANEQEQLVSHAAIMKEARTRLSGAWVWNPTPFMDLAPGTYRIDYWLDAKGNKRPIIIITNTVPERKIKYLNLGHWTVGYQDNPANHLRLKPAAVNFAGKNAEIIVDVPNKMEPQKEYTATITVKNTGETEWETTEKTKPFSYVLGAQNPHDNSIWGGRIELPRTKIASGDHVTVTATIKAPKEAGTYNFQYKMLQTGVDWFGQPSNNIAVQVVSQNTTKNRNNASFVYQEVPTTMSSGQTYTVKITYKNTGDTAWDKIGSQGDYGYAYRIKTAAPYDNLNWGVNYVPIPYAPIMPGETALFIFNVTPTVKPGNYTFQWGMNQGFIGWFGELTKPLTIQVISDAAALSTSTDRIKPAAGSESDAGVVDR